MIITAVEVRAVGEDHGWNFYSDDCTLVSTLTICRIITDCGVEGVGGVTQYSEHSLDNTSAAFLTDHLAPKLIGQNPFMREKIRNKLLNLEIYPAAPHPFAAVDIALWDLLGNATKTPLYILLGGAKASLPIQWSSPSFQTIKEYVDWAKLAARSCKAMKIHGFMKYEQDKKLTTAIKKAVPDDVLLCLDVENKYSFNDSVRMANHLVSEGFDWFEAPLPDKDMDLYRQLSERSSIDILPAGNFISDLSRFATAVTSRCWGRARFDVTVFGGITQAKKALGIAEAAGIRTEVQSWGHTLTAAANLHLMLGLGGDSYGSSLFEVAMPHQMYQVGMLDVLTYDGGHVRAPNSPACPGGLGVRVDWAEMDRLAHFHQTITLDGTVGKRKGQHQQLKQHVRSKL